MSLTDEQAKIFCIEGRLECSVCRGGKLFNNMTNFKKHLNYHKDQREFEERLAQYHQQVANLAGQQVYLKIIKNSNMDSSSISIHHSYRVFSLILVTQSAI
jgi:hypothetical protein